MKKPVRYYYRLDVFGQKRFVTYSLYLLCLWAEEYEEGFHFLYAKNF